MEKRTENEMVEQVTRRKFYHVTLTKQYKQAFILDQEVRVGEAYNAFFGFYEGSREYPVSQPDGSVLHMKAVAFLRQVRDGLIHTPQLAIIATEVAMHYITFCRELIMEEMRQSEFGGEPPSRQTCLF